MNNYQTILNQLKSNLDILTTQYNELPNSPDKWMSEKEFLQQATNDLKMVIESVESAERYNIRLINNPNL
jgi:hypothetical protein